MSVGIHLMPDLAAIGSIAEVLAASLSRVVALLAVTAASILGRRFSQ
jgi:hypothetical protein